MTSELLVEISGFGPVRLGGTQCLGNLGLRFFKVSFRVGRLTLEVTFVSTQDLTPKASGPQQVLSFKPKQ